MNTNKKAQAEMIGLVIIVVIITIAMLFYLSYVTTNTDASTKSNIRKEFEDNELSMSFVQTLIRTSIQECGDVSLDVLIKDCGLREFIINCDSDDFSNSCEAIAYVMEYVKNETLDVWDRSYSLAVKFGDDDFPLEPISFEAYECGKGTIGRRAPGIQPIPYYPEPGTAFLELGICKR